MTKNQKEKHTMEWDKENWKCLAKYGIDKGISKTNIINKILSEFLSRKDIQEEIERFRDAQAKAIAKRNIEMKS